MNKYTPFILAFVIILIAGIFIYLDTDSQSKGIDTGEVTRGIAVVNEVEILILESFPVQVRAVAKGDLPDACTTVGDVIQNRERSRFSVTVGTMRPADMVCAQVIVPFEESISVNAIGLKAGEYVVDVNGVEASFTLNSDNIMKDMGGETADLEAVGDYEGSGVSSRSFDGDELVHTVVADISDPSAGKFYEGWLVNSGEEEISFFSTGKLEKTGDFYTLNFTANQEFPGYDDVVVTEESEANGLDNQPEAHILEGSF